MGTRGRSDYLCLGKGLAQGSTDGEMEEAISRNKENRGHETWMFLDRVESSLWVSLCCANKKGHTGQVNTKCLLYV